jgi:hypothetical protein
MAKTLWPTSSPFGFITPALQELWWGISGATGHNHRGLDEDGSCPKIALSDSVSDYSTGTALGKVTTDYYDTEQLNISILWARIGKIVTVTIPTIVGTQAVESGLFRISPMTTWPAEMLATSGNPYVSVPLLSNSVMETGQIRLPSVGTDDFIADQDGSSTFAAGKGIRFTNITYRIAM